MEQSLLERANASCAKWLGHADKYIEKGKK